VGRVLAGKISNIICNRSELKPSASNQPFQPNQPHTHTFQVNLVIPQLHRKPNQHASCCLTFSLCSPNTHQKASKGYVWICHIQPQTLQKTQCAHLRISPCALLKIKNSYDSTLQHLRISPCALLKIKNSYDSTLHSELRMLISSHNTRSQCS